MDLIRKVGRGKGIGGKVGERKDGIIPLYFL
jgi:hypothetical protein